MKSVYSSTNVVGKVVFLAVFFFLTLVSFAQPQNDTWTNALPITIANGGFGIGTFNGSPVNVANASSESGEYIFSPVYSKTVWYSFTIPTARVVSVGVNQVGEVMQANDAGFFVYNQTSSIPSQWELSTFTPLMNFGSYSQNICLTAGTYFIQVVAKNSAAGDLFATIALEATMDAAFVNTGDEMDSPVQLGQLTDVLTTSLDWSCLSIESGAEYNLDYTGYQEFNKSYWCSFTTSNYLDGLSVLVDVNSPTYEPEGFTIRLFEGAVSAVNFTPNTALGELAGNSLNPFLNLQCDLQPNATYTIQLLGKSNYTQTSNMSIHAIGLGENSGALPTAAAFNLPSNYASFSIANSLTQQYDFYDYFSCSSLLSNSAIQCGTANPANFFIGNNNVQYDMTTWFAFSTDGTANLTFNSSIQGYSGCDGWPELEDLYYRLYPRNPFDDCSAYATATPLAEGSFINGPLVLNCFNEGDYAIQLFGRSIPISNDASCLGHLGSLLTLHLSTSFVVDPQFTLSENNDVNRINNFSPLAHNVNYVAASSSMGCNSSVVPSGLPCTDGWDRAFYRQLLIGDADNDAVADSGLLVINNYDVTNGGEHRLKSIFYEGDANELLMSEGDYSWPNQVDGLTPMMGCDMFNFETSAGVNRMKYCVTPGTYTLATLGDPSSGGSISQPSFRFIKSATLYSDWQNPEDIGDIINQGDIVLSEFDRFSCTDNPMTVGGYTACSDFTKQAYREFYLSEPASLTIRLENSTTSYTNAMRVFSGRISTNGPAALQLCPGQSETCIVGLGQVNQLYLTPDCEMLPAGWYTVVTYGFGPNYENNFAFHEEHLYDYSSSDLYAIGQSHRIRIEIASSGIAGPFYNRPGRASLVNGGNPLVYTNIGSTSVPSPFTVYVCDEEHFGSTTDSLHMMETFPVCSGSNRVAYYVFTTAEPCFMQIMDVEVLLLYKLNATTSDSLLFMSTAPIIGCPSIGNAYCIDYLEAGTYTMVCLASEEYTCSPMIPVICMAPLGFSRFEYAKHAYDFGELPADNTYRFGRLGDVHPHFPGIPPSLDTFYSSTGSEASDPEDICDVSFTEEVNSVQWNVGSFASDSLDEDGLYRNLWYTIVTRGKGRLDLILRNRVGSDPLMAALYQSDVNGNLSWQDVINTGQIDSTYAQGLTLLTKNHIDSVCMPSMHMMYDFDMNGCGADTTMRRLYLLVAMKKDVPLNLTFDIRAKWNPQQGGTVPAMFDHVATAGQIGTGGLQPNMQYTGEWDELSCASATIADGETACATPNRLRSIWYRFEVEQPSFVRIATENQIGYTPTMRLLRVNSDFASNPDTTLSFDANDGFYVLPQGVNAPLSNSPYSWMGYCIEPGVYYIQYSRCAEWEDAIVRPVVYLESIGGDDCSDPITVDVNGTGVYSGSSPIWCHSVGSDFGEDGTQMGCLSGPSGYSTTWFKFNYTGSEVVDVLFQPNLTGLSNFGSTSQVRYRLFYGNDCSSMVVGSECSVNALINNSIACINSETGKFLIQVEYPSNARGSLAFNFNVTPSLSPNCTPFNPALVDAEFIHYQTCARDSVYFENYSTSGPSVTHHWNFGDGNESNEFHVNHAYEQAGQYTVSLVVSNSNTGMADSIIQVIDVLEPGFPLHLDDQAVICENESLLLNAAVDNATYLWSTNESSSEIEVSETGTYHVVATVGNCSYADSIAVTVAELFFDFGSDQLLCENENIVIDPMLGNDVQYLWMNGSTSPSLLVEDPQLVWLEVTQGNCFFRDSLNIVGLDTLSITSPEFEGWCGNHSLVELTNAFLPLNGHISIDYLNDLSIVEGVDFFDPSQASGTSITTSTIYYEIENENGCISRAEKQVQVYPVPTLSHVLEDACQFESMAVQTNTETFGQGIDMFTLSVEGLAPIDLSQQSSFSLDESGSYVYTISLTTETGCSVSNAGTLSIAAIPEVTLTVDGNCESEVFQFDAAVSNSIDGMDQISWFIDGLPSGVGSPLLAPINSPGEHTVAVSVHSTAGCVSHRDSLFIVYDAPELSISASDMCLNQPAVITTSAAVEYGSITSFQTTVNNTAIYTTDVIDLVPAQTGSLSIELSATTDHGCTRVLSSTVEVFDVPAITMVGENNSVCYGDNIAFEVENEGNAEVLYYTWHYGGNQQIGGSNYTIQGSLLGSNELWVEAVSVDGCISSPTPSVWVNVMPPIDVDFSFSPNELSFAQPEVTCVASISGIELSESYFSANGLVFSENQTGRFTFNTEGWHELSLYVEDIHGCSATESKQIFFNGDALVYIPNAFTPTNDFLNEVFGPVITATNIQKYSFTIYNRWGAKVFDTSDPEMMWNGSVNNSSYYAGDGVYSYRIVFTYEGGKPFEKIGHITVFR